MRRAFARQIEAMADDPSIIFLTGDLGYNAFENLQLKMGERFMNVGVAEQNMIGVAAGLAHNGFKVFCYSIAPFITYRCLEQIRIDVCHHRLPVFIVGNGGGFGYGIMGASHHAVSDLACMSSLPFLTCYIPSFTEDVALSMNEMVNSGKPSYLRLGIGKSNPSVQNGLAGLKCIHCSADAMITIVALGPLIHNVLEAIEDSPAKTKSTVFSAVKIPFDNFDTLFTDSLVKTKKLLIVEEHVSRGGLSEYIALQLMKRGLSLDNFNSLHAHNLPDELSGDQEYYQRKSGIDKDSIRRIILDWLNV